MIKTSIRILLLLLLTLSVNSWADTTIVSCTFTVVSQTPLESAVDKCETGNDNWTQEASTCAEGFVVDAADYVRMSGLDANCQTRNSAQPNSSQTEYYVQANFIDGGVLAAGDVIGILGRCISCTSATLQDYYLVRANDDNNTAYSFIKIIDAVPTSLGTGGGFEDTANEVIKLELKDATKKVFEAGIEVISSADNAITSAGVAGLGCGRIDGTTTSDCSNLNRFDNFSIVEISAVTSYHGIIISWLDKFLSITLGYKAYAQEVVRNGQWRISPLVRVNGVWMPKAQTIPDPGRPLLEDDLGTFTIPDYCRMSNVIAEGFNWVLSYISCISYANLDSDPEIIFVADEKIDALTTKLSSLSANKRNKLKQIVGAKISTTLRDTNTLEEWLEALGTVINPNFKAMETWAQ